MIEFNQQIADSEATIEAKELGLEYINNKIDETNALVTIVQQQVNADKLAMEKMQTYTMKSVYEENFYKRVAEAQGLITKLTIFTNMKTLLLKEKSEELSQVKRLKTIAQLAIEYEEYDRLKRQ